MKKVILILLITLSGMGAYAQEGFKLGIQAGLPYNDFNDISSVMVGADFGYMRALGEVVDLGIMTGFVHGFPKTFVFEEVGVETEDNKAVDFVPLALSTRIWPSQDFSLGVDVGYAFGITEGIDGGLYFRPIIGYLFGTYTEINASHSTIKLDGASWTTINFGILHTFKSKRTR
ncbi:hypothetical protein N9954_01875 [Maribacter sp.]|nr:hypothetical protein [Maribacter sp.]